MPVCHRFRALAVWELWVWLFVVLVTLADLHFFWMGRHLVEEWELNPVARAVFMSTGMMGTVTYRVGLLWFAMAASTMPVRYSWVVTAAWALGHLYLLVVLVMAYPYLRWICGR